MVDKAGESHKWAVEVSTVRDIGKETVLQALNEGLGDPTLVLYLLYVITDVPTSGGADLPVSKASAESLQEYEEYVSDSLLKPLRLLAEKRQIRAIPLLVKNDHRAAGLCEAVAQVGASKLYLGVKRKLLWGGASSLVLFCESHLPPGCRIAIVQGGKKVRELRAHARPLKGPAPSAAADGSLADEKANQQEKGTAAAASPEGGACRGRDGAASDDETDKSRTLRSPILSRQSSQRSPILSRQSSQRSPVLSRQGSQRSPILSRQGSLCSDMGSSLLGQKDVEILEGLLGEASTAGGQRLTGGGVRAGSFSGAAEIPKPRKTGGGGQHVRGISVDFGSPLLSNGERAVSLEQVAGEQEGEEVDAVAAARSASSRRFPWSRSSPMGLSKSSSSRDGGGGGSVAAGTVAELMAGASATAPGQKSRSLSRKAAQGKQQAHSSSHLHSSSFSGFGIGLPAALSGSGHDTSPPFTAIGGVPQSLSPEPENVFSGGRSSGRRISWSSSSFDLDRDRIPSMIATSSISPGLSTPPPGRMNGQKEESSGGPKESTVPPRSPRRNYIVGGGGSVEGPLLSQKDKESILEGLLGGEKEGEIAQMGERGEGRGGRNLAGRGALSSSDLWGHLMKGGTGAEIEGESERFCLSPDLIPIDRPHRGVGGSTLGGGAGGGGRMRKNVSFQEDELDRLMEGARGGNVEAGAAGGGSGGHSPLPSPPLSPPSAATVPQSTPGSALKKGGMKLLSVFKGGGDSGGKAASKKFSTTTPPPSPPPELYGMESAGLTQLAGGSMEASPREKSVPRSRSSEEAGAQGGGGDKGGSRGEWAHVPTKHWLSFGKNKDKSPNNNASSNLPTTSALQSELAEENKREEDAERLAAKETEDEEVERRGSKDDDESPPSSGSSVNSVEFLRKVAERAERAAADRGLSRLGSTVSATSAILSPVVSSNHMQLHSSSGNNLPGIRSPVQSATPTLSQTLSMSGRNSSDGQSGGASSSFASNVLAAQAGDSSSMPVGSTTSNSGINIASSSSYQSGGMNNSASGGGGGDGGGGGGSDCRRFSVQELLTSTNGFSDAKLLGRGAYGPVFQGQLFGCQVAIKKLEAGSEQGPAEFRTEVEVLSKVRHPHIVLLMGQCPEESCIVYEFMSGGNLQERIVRGGASPPPPLAWHERFRIASEMAGALLFLHRHNPPILHRDLKPDNILLDANNVSKVADVGLARLIPEEVCAKTWKVRGTAGYIDPEEIQTGELSTKSDIYAFGLIVLQLMTGLKNVKQLHRLLAECGTGSRDVERATTILMGNLDSGAGRWPTHLAREAIQVAVRCIERKRAARPDLDIEIHPTFVELWEEAAEEKAKRAKEVDSRFSCPLSQERMRDPVVAGDGFTYERTHIEKWMEKNDVSPITKLKLPHRQLTPNHILASLLENMF